MIERESYRRGFEDALEAIEYLVFVEKWPLKKALDHLKYSVKIDKINTILDELGIPKKLQ